MLIRSVARCEGRGERGLQQELVAAEELLETHGRLRARLDAHGHEQGFQTGARRASLGHLKQIGHSAAMSTPYIMFRIFLLHYAAFICFWVMI